MKKTALYFLIIVLILSLLSVFRIDYYIMQPGSAHDVSGYVTVDGGDTDDTGTLSLMTVSMYQATPLTYVLAKIRDYRKIMTLDQVRNPHEDEEEYNVRQLKLMEDSQFNAKFVAFKEANLSYKVNYEGIYVLNVIEGGASEDILKTGDQIIALNDKKIETQNELIQKLTTKKIGDNVTLTIVRNKKKLNVSINLKAIPGDNKKRAGLGITYAENKSIQTDPEVNIATEDIGGPSAGLMFTLGMLNQLLDEDITKGYNIAGTGEMLEDGTVGRIGGIDMKVIAADQANMDIFFAPDDAITDEMKKLNPTIESNYSLALKTAKEIGTDMKIVPVKTIQDALDYLDGL